MQTLYNTPGNNVFSTTSKRYFLFVILFLFSAQLFAQPVITSFSPVSGSVGSAVTITGGNFSITPANNIVFFGAVKANVSAATTTSLSVTVPTGATYEPITVTVNGLTAYSNKPFIITFAGGGQIEPSTFETKIDIQTDLHPNGIVIADFNGDGKSDLATANNYSTAGSPASVSIVRNTGTSGTISFAPKQDISNGVLTYAIAAGDLNGDGKPDLVASSIADQNISVFKNTSTTGNISFAQKINYSAGDNSYSISITDLDKDGKPEMIVANFLSNSISVFKNTSTIAAISFAPKVDYITELAPHNIATGDLDGDGKADLAITNFLSKSISIFKNTSSPGTISFAAKTNIATGTDNPFDVSIADIDGDGKADLAITNNNYTSVQDASVTFSLMRNTSTGGNISFAQGINFYFGNAHHISFGDINGDGKPDIAIPNTNNRLTLYQNNSVPGTISMTNPSHHFSISPYQVGIGDLDGDGEPDIAAANFTSESVSVFRSRVTSPTIHYVSPTTAGSGETVTITGINFTGATQVSFGGVPALSFTVVSSSTITAVLGSGVSGDVVVTTPQGTATISGFVYKGAPTITSFTPATSGGYGKVVIKGTNLAGATAVSFGGTPADNFTVVSPTTIEAFVAPGSGNGNVSVTTPYGTASLAGFVFVALPTITGFSPAAAKQGDEVTITGTNFIGVTAVSFGDVLAASFTVQSSTTIKARVGSGQSGNVKVIAAGGEALRAGFIILPTILSFSPTTGVTGSVITISGANFSAVTEVRFGGIPASSFTIVSPTSITAVVANGQSGDVSLINSGGSVSRSGFTYIGPPVIETFSPVRTGTGGTVTIKGSNFNSGVTAVSFGDIAAGSFTVVDDKTIIAKVATGATGNIKVTGTGGTSSASLFYFTNLPIINSFSPTRGVAGTTVTITGANFDPDANKNFVYFGAVKAAVLSASSNSLSVTVPAGATYSPISVTTGERLTAYSTNTFLITFPGDKPITTNSFSGKMDIATAGGPQSLTSSDVDGDGKADLIVANSESSSISVFKNLSANGNLSFAPKIEFTTVDNPYYVSPVDMDGDGKQDLVIFTFHDGRYRGFVFKNTSTAGAISFVQTIEFYPNHSPGDMVVGDLNNDGKTDLAIINTNIKPNNIGLPITIMRNSSSNGNISFEEFDYFNLIYINKSGLHSDQSPLNVCIGDLDHNGELDMAIGYSSDYYQNEITLVKGSIFSPNFQQLQESIYNPNKHLFTGDFDMDGNTDIISDLTVFRNTGNFSFDQQRVSGVNGISAIADLNGDGKPDFVNANNFSSSVSVSENITAGSTITFNQKIDFATGNNPNSILVGDLDGDGKPEIATANAADNTISILKNQAGSNILQVCSGGDISFASDIVGSAYQWQVNTGSGFTNLADNANYAGATAKTLQLKKVPSGWNNYQYRCIVNNANASKTFTLTVKPAKAPSVTVTASQNPFCEATPALFTAKTDDGGTDAKYQWQVNGTDASYVYNTFKSFDLKTNDEIRVVLTSNASCLTAPVANSNIIKVTITPSLKLRGKMTIPDTVCAGSPYKVTFTGMNTPVGSSVRLAELYPNGHGPASQPQLYNNVPLIFEVTSDLIKDYTYAFKITPSSSPNCEIEGFSDTAIIKSIAKLITPIIVANNGELSVSNPDPTATYYWQVSGNDIVPAATGTTFKATVSGTYRVRMNKGACNEFSSPQSVLITAINTVPASSLGIRLYPNPVTNELTIDTLKLADRWETMDILDASGKQKLANMNIRMQSKLSLNVASWPGGLYFVVLKRKMGSRQ